MHEIISSAQNPTVKHLRKLLTSAKYRREQGLAIAEGTHLASSFLQTDRLPQQIIYAEAALHNQEVVDLVDQLEASIPVIVLKDSLFEFTSQIHASSGLMIVFEPVTPTAQDRLVAESLLLEEVQDPGNLGTILRTAAAAGLRQVYLSPGSASPWSPKSLRAGMGAQFDLSIYENVDLLSLIKNSDIPVLATDLLAQQTIYQADLGGDYAWLFGNEGQGVSPDLLAVCSQRLSIPQAETTVESLNVAAAVAVCLFEQRRQGGRLTAARNNI